MSGASTGSVRILFRRRTAVSLVFSGAVLTGIAGSFGMAAIRSGSAFGWVIFAVFALFALTLLTTALVGVLSRRPVIEAGEHGVTIALFGGRPMTVGWQEIAGFEVVGKGRGRMLVITGIDPAVLARHIPSQRKVTESFNRKYRLPGIIYIHQAMMRVHAEAAAAQLRTLALEHLQPAAAEPSA